MFINDRQRKATFARLASVSSLSPDDNDLKKQLDGRYISLASRYKAPESLLMQNNAFGLDVGGVLVTKNFVPKFQIFDQGDYFKDTGRNTLYVVNYRDLPSEQFIERLKKIKAAATEQQLKVESTQDPLGF